MVLEPVTMGSMPEKYHRQGLALIEAVAVVAVFAIVLSFGVWWSHRYPRAATVAQNLVRVVVASRWSAVHEGVPRSLVQGASGDEIRVMAGGYTCDDGAAGARVVWARPPRTFVSWPAMGLAFAPDGRPRRCDGSGVGNTTVLIEGPRGDRAAVIVASLGRVRWEQR